MGSTVPFGFRVDHEVLEAVVKELGPSLMHLHPPGAVYTLPEHSSDRCRLRPLIGAVSVCLERGAELGDGVGIRRHLDEGTNHLYGNSAVIAVGLKFFRKMVPQMFFYVFGV